jgi:hypothetical protein
VASAFYYTFSFPFVIPLILLWKEGNLIIGLYFFGY